MALSVGHEYSEGQARGGRRGGKEDRASGAKPLCGKTLSEISLAGSRSCPPSIGMAPHAAKHAEAMEQAGFALSQWQESMVSQLTAVAIAWPPDAPKSMACNGTSEIASKTAAQTSLRTIGMNMDEPIKIKAIGLPVHGQVTEAAQGFS